ncbi:MAG: hypothetical protein K1X51_13440 [Rhodospirillaceae bacterium]|nr:hypothetical protein [Rhodospirillaceae bacterium]
MSNDQPFLTRRCFGAAVVVGGASFVLGTMNRCSGDTYTIVVHVDENAAGGPRVVDIVDSVPKGTKKIRFVAERGWIFRRKDNNDPVNGVPVRRGPRIWLDGENPLTIALSDIIENQRVCETEKVPDKDHKLHVYFAMSRPDRSPGDCGGGGSVEAE